MYSIGNTILKLHFVGYMPKKGEIKAFHLCIKLINLEAKSLTQLGVINFIILLGASLLIYKHAICLLDDQNNRKKI